MYLLRNYSTSLCRRAESLLFRIYCILIAEVHKWCTILKNEVPYVIFSGIQDIMDRHFRSQLDGSLLSSFEVRHNRRSDFFWVSGFRIRYFGISLARDHSCTTLALAGGERGLKMPIIAYFQYYKHAYLRRKAGRGVQKS